MNATITEGTKIVTVARDGGRTANVGRMSFPIYVTAVYVAKARLKDGKLTWRRLSSVGDSTSGMRPTAPMVRAAKEYEAAVGLSYEDGIRHGSAA